MNLWKTGMVGVCCGVLGLTGCESRDTVQSLKASQINMKDDIQALRKDVRTLEQSIQILHQEFIALRSRAAEPAVPRDIKAESEDNAKSPTTSKDYTREQCESKVIGMTSDQLIEFAGTPDQKNTLGTTDSWTYNQFSCRGYSNALEYYSLQIVLETGRVNRVIFTGDIYYGVKE